MNKKRKALFVFVGLSLALACLFFLFPINLFDGVIVEKHGLQTIVHERNLSLSYFIGLGYDPQDLEFIEDFYLTTKGKVMAVIFIFGFPALLAYRVFLRSDDM